MSDSGHSQPGMYGPGRRRRRRMEPGLVGNLNLSGYGRESDYMPRDRDPYGRDCSEDTSSFMMQKVPIILAKPPAERSKQAPVATPATAPMEKPIVLMKSREEGKGAPSADGGPQASASTAKVEKEGQRPTQPVYQIQNRGMGSSAPGSMLDRFCSGVGYRIQKSMCNLARFVHKLTSHPKLADFGHPFEVSLQPKEITAMDFITDLPPSENKITLNLSGSRQWIKTRKTPMRRYSACAGYDSLGPSWTQAGLTTFLSKLGQ